MSRSPELSLDAVGEFLAERFGQVEGLEAIDGGEWSSVFGFVGDGRALVVRFGHHVEDYRKDVTAAAWSRPALPIPPVVELTDGPAATHAVISDRVPGTTSDRLDGDAVNAALPSLIDALAALRHVEPPGHDFGDWATADDGFAFASWAEYLTHLPHVDHPRLGGWREKLAALPEAQRAFDAGNRALAEITPNLPEVRHVVHNDLSAGNVLIADGRVTGVIDWGNSLAGDPVYDLANLVTWAPWHGYDAQLVLDLASDRLADSDIEARLHACRLHLAVEHVMYMALFDHHRSLRWLLPRTWALME